MEDIVKVIGIWKNKDIINICAQLFEKLVYYEFLPFPEHRWKSFIIQSSYRFKQYIPSESSSYFVPVTLVTFWIL